MTGTLTPLLQASVVHRKAILKRIRMELTDPRYDNARKVLMTMAILDRSMAEADAELARLSDEPPAVEVENEDGGYEDRDPLQNAVKGDLGGYE